MIVTDESAKKPEESGVQDDELTVAAHQIEAALAGGGDTGM